MTSTPSPPATADRVAHTLRERVLSGGLPPGTALRDSVLALDLGVSRNTVREAFRLLGGEGLTQYVMHRGTVVATLHADDIRDIYVVRRTLELRAVEQSAAADPADMEQVGATVQRSERLLAQERWQEVGTASLQFHAALVRTLRSPSLDAFMRTTLSRLRLAFAIMPDEAEFQVSWIDRDREINDLVQQGRVRLAGDALRSYLEDSEMQVLAAVRRSTATAAGPARPSSDRLHHPPRTEHVARRTRPTPGGTHGTH